MQNEPSQPGKIWSLYGAWSSSRNKILTHAMQEGEKTLLLVLCCLPAFQIAFIVHFYHLLPCSFKEFSLLSDQL